jgi:hypothetical protein
MSSASSVALQLMFIVPHADGLAGAGMVAGALGVGAIILGAAALMMRSRR